MRLLLDTHVVLWGFADDPALSPGARSMIADPGNPVFVSAVSAWEVAVKKGLGKLEAPADFEDQVNTHRYEPLDITIAHAWAVESLPMLHKDPFDRLLVAQAMLESLTIVTRDRNIARYDVSVVPA